MSLTLNHQQAREALAMLHALAHYSPMSAPTAKMATVAESKAAWATLDNFLRQQAALDESFQGRRILLRIAHDYLAALGRFALGDFTSERPFSIRFAELREQLKPMGVPPAPLRPARARLAQMTEKAAPWSYADYRGEGWTDEQLIEAGLMDYAPPGLPATEANRRPPVPGATWPATGRQTEGMSDA